jgi:hypothetical protein
MKCGEDLSSLSKLGAALPGAKDAVSVEVKCRMSVGI